MEISNSLFPEFIDTQPESPFAEYAEFKSRSSRDAAAMLNNKVVPYTIEQIAELIASGEFSKTENFVYTDTNKNGVFGDDGDTKQYPVIFYYGKDAIKLEKIYKSVTPKKDEVLVFIEDQKGDVFSGKSIFIKLGSEIKKKYHDNPDAANIFLAGIPKLGYGDINAGEKIVEIINAQSGQVENMNELEIVMNYVVEPLIEPYMEELEIITDYAADIPIDALNGIIQFLESLQFKEIDWNPESANKRKGFTPYFFPFLKFKQDQKAYLAIKGADIPVEKILLQLEKNVGNKFESINNGLDNHYNTLMKVLETVSLGLFEKGVTKHSPLHGLIENLKKVINNFIRYFVEIAIEGTIFYNALMCGLINSIIGIFIGIFELINLIFKANKYSTKLLQSIGDWTEYLDNFLQALLKLDLIKIFMQINYFLDNVLVRLGSAAWKYLKSLSTAEYGFFIGYVIGFIIELVLGAVTFGGTTVNAILGKSMKAFKAIISTLEAIFKRIIKKVGKNIFESLSNFTEFLSKGTDDVLKFLDEIWTAFLNWLDEGTIVKSRNGKYYIRSHFGSEALTEAEILAWEKKLLTSTKSKCRLRSANINRRILKQMEAKNEHAFFDAETIPPVIWYRDNPTEYVFKHESYHLEEFELIGKKEFLKGRNGTKPEVKLNTLLRERYVYHKILENKDKFTASELAHANWYYNVIVAEAKKVGVVI